MKLCLSSVLVWGLAAAAVGCSGGDEAPAAPPQQTQMETGACADAPDFVLFEDVVGDMGVMKAARLAASPAPPERNENDWTVEFRDLDDAPVADVMVTMVQPFMPAHNHDGTFDPTVVPLDDPGKFDIQAINLWMPGMWEVRFTVESETVGADYIVFDACIPE